MDNLDLATVYARNCSVKKISEAEAKPFIDTNHRMGYCSCRHRYGLYVERATGSGELRLPEGTLVAVATFSNLERRESRIVRMDTLCISRLSPGSGRHGQTAGGFLHEHSSR